MYWDYEVPLMSPQLNLSQPYPPPSKLKNYIPAPERPSLVPLQQQLNHLLPHLTNTIKSCHMIAQSAMLTPHIFNNAESCHMTAESAILTHRRFWHPSTIENHSLFLQRKCSGPNKPCLQARCCCCVLSILVQPGITTVTSMQHHMTLVLGPHPLPHPQSKYILK